MPKSFKGYPPGANPKSFRGVRRPAPPSQPTYMGGIGLGGTNLLKTRWAAYGTRRCNVRMRGSHIPCNSNCRVIQSGLYHMCSGGLLLIMAIVRAVQRPLRLAACSFVVLFFFSQVADSQYGFARRFSKEIVGAGLLTVTFLKAGLELVSSNCAVSRCLVCPPNLPAFSSCLCMCW